MEYAKTLIKKRPEAGSEDSEEIVDDNREYESSDSWTDVGNDVDTELEEGIMRSDWRSSKRYVEIY